MSHEISNPFTNKLPIPNSSRRKGALLGPQGVVLWDRQQKRHGSDRTETEGSVEGFVPLELKEDEFLLFVPPGSVPTKEVLFGKRPEGYGFEMLQDRRSLLFLGKSASEIGLKERHLDLWGIDDVETRAMLIAIDQEREGTVVATLVDVKEFFSLKNEEEVMGQVGVSIKQLILTMDKLGYRPGTAKELLALAKAFWKEHDESVVQDGDRDDALNDERLTNVLALGSIADNEWGGYMPRIYIEGGGRRTRIFGTNNLNYLMGQLLFVRRDA